MITGGLVLIGAALNMVLLFGSHAPAWFLLAFLFTGGGLVTLRGAHL